ncbi:hypothetical protein LCGC14_1854290 [marine sediment metagenome]|uniref:Uncharacterized protein n=1 Tax=marine sediment metagenome TaxID=412755 RepID=A0A0F9J8M5_9ZZZZ
MENVQFMTAGQKYLTLRQWKRFLESGLSEEKFTKMLYHHLIQHCDFIAHYSREGFYGTYFSNGDSIVRFLSQFDTTNGVPRSIESHSTHWLAGGNDVSAEYYDINNEMCRVAAKYIPVLITAARVQQKEHDVSLARRLLAKHDVELIKEEVEG